MKMWFIYAVAVITAGCAISAYSADFSRYDIILEKKPFGDLAKKAAEADKKKPPEGLPLVPAEPPFKNIRLVAITSTEWGIRVGIVDIGINPPKSYSLKIGEEEDGITVVDADYDEEAVQLQKGTEKEWINMKGSSSLGSPSLAASGSGSKLSAGNNLPASTPESFAERLKARREARIKAPPMEPPKMSAEELDKHLKEYQMQVIREGGPALPMELTPAMDEQLVKEGVLPPR